MNQRLSWLSCLGSRGRGRRLDRQTCGQHFVPAGCPPPSIKRGGVRDPDGRERPPIDLATPASNDLISEAHPTYDPSNRSICRLMGPGSSLPRLKKPGSVARDDSEIAA